VGHAREGVGSRRDTPPPGELEAALARGAELDLDQVVAEILACDMPEAHWGAGAEGAPAESDGPRQ